MSESLKTTSLPQAVYDAMRSSILTMQLAPDEIVTETAVALRFGVARPTAKAAIERLVIEGLLRRQAHRAARVPQLSRLDIEDLYANRALIEGEALRNLAATSVVPAAALSAQRDLVASAEADDRAALARDDIAFHRALVTGQPSERLARMHALIMGEVELGIGQVQSHQLMKPVEIVTQHQAILDAVAERDPARAADLTHRHIAIARDRLLSKYDADHAPKESQ
jgi:DNA-binding GntR family transcriptional regulator